MMKIDLLPVEEKKIERTPTPRLIVILIGTAILTSLIFLNIIAITTIPANDVIISGDQQQIQALKIYEKEYAELSQKHTTLQKYIKDLKTLCSRKFFWVEPLTIICNILDKEKYRYSIIVEDIRVYSGSRVLPFTRKLQLKTPTPFVLELVCEAKGKQISLISDLYEDIKHNQRLQEIFPFIDTDPEIKLVEAKGPTEEHHISFVIRLFASYHKL